MLHPQIKLFAIEDVPQPQRRFSGLWLTGAVVLIINHASLSLTFDFLYHNQFGSSSSSKVMAVFLGGDHFDFDPL